MPSQNSIDNLFIHKIFVQVTDKREVHFEDKRSEVFTGAGQTLGGETKPSRLVPSNLQDTNTNPIQTSEPVNNKRETTNEVPGIQMSMEQFLQKLPRSVVKSGKVIDIRSSVGDTLHVSSVGDTLHVSSVGSNLH